MPKLILVVSLLLFCLFRLTSAASLRLRISPSTHLPNPNELPSTTHATLTSEDGQILHALLRKDNTIYFPDITSIGSHLLDIHSRDHVFAPYRIDTSQVKGKDEIQIAGAWETYRGTSFSDRGVPLTPSPTSSLTIQPKVLGAKSFYEERPAFSPLSLLKNPMILMGGVALIFTFGMPKLMENMDPEMRQEYEEIQRKGPVSSLMGRQQPASNPADFDLAGYLAGSGKSSGGGGGGTSTGSSKDGADGIRDRRR